MDPVSTLIMSLLSVCPFGISWFPISALILFISTVFSVTYFSFSPPLHISALLVPFDLINCMLWRV